jgi:hypothetical protein
MRALVADLATFRFWRHFLRSFLTCVGALAAVLGLYDVFFPGSIAAQVRTVSLAVLVASLVYGLWASWPRPIEASYNTPNTRIRVVRGDLFDEDGHLVVGICDTFDTRVPDVIAKDSVQGQLLYRVFDGNVDELDRQLEATLSRYESIGEVQKPGKTKRYPLGTVVTLRENTRKCFLVAYTEMNERNEARATADGVWRSLLSLWRAVCEHSNGAVVSMAAIGGGQARLSQVLPVQDSIRFIALSFMLASRRERVCSELRIVVPPAQFDKLDHLQLQSFLNSLRAS